MPQIGYDPATGRLTLDGQVLDRNDPRMYGSVGSNVLDASTLSGGALSDASRFDPRYYEAYTAYDGDNGEITRYRLKPEVEQRLGGRIQLGQSGVGGHAETIDPGKVEWDDEFGMLTSRDNYSAPDPGTFFDQNGLWLMMLPAAYGALSAGGAFGGGAAGGLTEGASAGGLLDIPGNLAWTDIAAANPEMAAAPEIFGGAGASAAGAAAFTPPSTPLMLAPGMENAAMIDSWLINNGLSGLAGGGLTAGLGMLGGDSITGAGLLGAGRAGLTAAGLLGSAFGGGGSSGGGGGWSGGGIPGGGLDIKDATYVPNQQTERQLQELYGSNSMGAQSGGQQMPWQNNLYGGGQQQNMSPMGGGMAPSTQAYMPGGSSGGMGPMQSFGQPQDYSGLLGRMQGEMGGFGKPDAQTYGQPKPMAIGDGFQQYSAKPMMGGDFGPLPPGQPIGQPGNGTSIQNGRLMIGGQAAPNLMPQVRQQIPINDQYVDQSVKNSAIGDGFSGLRNGFLFAGGQRLMPTTGSAQQDQATLRQFGIRPPTFGPQYGF